MKTLTRLLPLVWLLPGAGSAYEIKVSAAVEPKTVTIGDRIAYEAVFDLPAGFRAFPAFEISATRFDPWEVLDVKPLDPAAAAGAARQRVLVTLTVWSATVTSTPALPFRITAPGIKTQDITVPPVAITVESVLAKAEQKDQLRPPRGMIEFRSWFWWIVGGILLAAAVGGWILWSRRRKRLALLAAGIDPSVPIRPPEEVAREALAALLASPLLAERGPKSFYIELGDILRRYLEGRFGVPALDRTTAELLPELRQVAALRSHHADVRDFFDTCDLVKFARFTPAASDIDGDVARARAIIDGTAPRRTALESMPVTGAGAPR